MGAWAYNLAESLAVGFLDPAKPRFRATRGTGR